jgi:hypothetical protein
MELTRLKLMPGNVARTLATAWLVVASCGVSAFAQAPAKSVPPAPLLPPPAFYPCRMTYALCTFSSCDVVVLMGDKATTTCDCKVITDGWSVGAKDCKADKPDDTHVKSRYFPIRTYARCSNKRPWAMCLDSDCTLDKNDKTKAACTCSVKRDVGDYLIEPDSPGTPSQCDTGIISSATVLDLDTVTDFLEKQDKMPVYDMLVVNPQKPQPAKK